MREPVGEVPLLGYDRVQQAQTKVAHLAQVTGRRDCKTFSLALMCHFVTIFPRDLHAPFACFQLLLFLPVARWSRLNIESPRNLLYFSNSQSVLVTLWWPLFPVLFRVVCLQSLCVSACRTRALTRTDQDTHADSSLAQGRSQKTSHTFATSAVHRTLKPVTRCDPQTTLTAAAVTLKPLVHVCLRAARVTDVVTVMPYLPSSSE